MKEITNTSGVYIITNLITNEFYIGSSKDMKARVLGHFNKLKGDRHENFKLQRVYNHGDYNFEVLALEECAEGLLIEREQYYIDTLKPTYNISLTAGRTSGYTQTEEAKLKMSESKKKLYQEGFTVWNKGIDCSEITRSKIRETLKGRIYTGRNGRLFQFDKDTNEVLNVFISSGEFAKVIGKRRKTVTNKILETLTADVIRYGYKWKFEIILAPVKVDELLETLALRKQAISSQAIDKSIEGSETTCAV